jgi:hypothetical protein
MEKEYHFPHLRETGSYILLSNVPLPFGPEKLFSCSLAFSLECDRSHLQLVSRSRCTALWFASDLLKRPRSSCSPSMEDIE